MLLIASNEGLFRKEKLCKFISANGKAAKPLGQVYGIVEFKDGVRRVDPVSIKFCDEENAILCEMAKHHEALRRGEANAES